MRCSPVQLLRAVLGTFRSCGRWLTAVGLVAFGLPRSCDCVTATPTTNSPWCHNQPIMRMAQIELQDFRCFEHVTVDLDRLTVVAGPNDGGKSTFVDAIRSLFEEKDRMNRPFTYANVKRRLPGQTPTADALSAVRGEAIPANPTWVLASFDLVPSDGLAWRSCVVASGRVQFGRYWKANAAGQRCIVVPDSHIAELSPQVDEWDRWYAEALVARTNHGHWLALDDWRSLVAPVLEDDFFPPVDPLVFVHVPGPDGVAVGPADVLRRLIVRRVGNDDAEGTALDFWFHDNRLQKAIAASKDVVMEQYSFVVDHYLPGMTAATAITAGRVPTTEQIADAILEDMRVELLNKSSLVDVRTLGAGSQRAATIAAVELFTHPGLVRSESDLAFIVLEEPEVGLHPAAQHRVAGAINNAAQLAPHVQFLVVTHSPVFLDMADSSSVRVCRPRANDTTDCTVQGLIELTDRLEGMGLTPRDALLASHVLVVEGESDAAVLSMWSIANGRSLTDARVTIVPARGHGPVEQIARVLSLVYNAVPLTIVLDNGADTARKRLEIQEKFGGRVSVHLLGESQIEAYFSDRAINVWARNIGAGDARVADLLSYRRRDHSKQWLIENTPVLVPGRTYDVVRDGAAIAGVMTEEEIPVEVRGLLSSLT